MLFFNFIISSFKSLIKSKSKVQNGLGSIEVFITFPAQISWTTWNLLALLSAFCCWKSFWIKVLCFGSSQNQMIECGIDVDNIVRWKPIYGVIETILWSKWSLTMAPFGFIETINHRMLVPYIFVAFDRKCHKYRR